MKFNNTTLVVEQIIYAAKTESAYDLDNCPKIPLRGFTSKMLFFGVTNIPKNSVNSECVYSGYGISFDGKGELNFGNIGNIWC